MNKVIVTAMTLAFIASPAYARKVRKHHVTQGYEDGTPIVAGSNAVRVNQAGQVLAPPIVIKSTGTDGKVPPRS